MGLGEELGRVVVHIESQSEKCVSVDVWNVGFEGPIATIRAVPDAVLATMEVPQAEKSANVASVAPLNFTHPNTPCFESLDNLAAIFVTTTSA
jgi:hypothetical protein